ncbi:MAG: hypothetical protein AAGJ40_00030 [Planctomycetota bacterium]
MDREPWRVDPKFNELTKPDVPLDDFGRDLKVGWVLSVHGDSVHQLVVVGETLGVKLLFQYRYLSR